MVTKSLSHAQISLLHPIFSIRLRESTRSLLNQAFASIELYESQHIFLEKIADVWVSSVEVKLWSLNSFVRNSPIMFNSSPFPWGLKGQGKSMEQVVRTRATRLIAHAFKLEFIIMITWHHSKRHKNLRAFHSEKVLACSFCLETIVLRFLDYGFYKALKRVLLTLLDQFEPFVFLLWALSHSNLPRRGLWIINEVTHSAPSSWCRHPTAITTTLYYP